MEWEIGAFIAALRRERGWTQVELGERLGVTNKTVSRWETGRYMPDLGTLEPLCGLLGVGINELLSGRRLDDGEFQAAAENNLLAALGGQRALRRKKTLTNLLGGGGTGILLSTLYAPYSLRRTLTALTGLAMVAAAWAVQAHLDRRIFGGRSGAEPSGPE